MIKICVVIVNYKTPELVLNCLVTIEREIDSEEDRVVIVDNNSADNSIEFLNKVIKNRSWGTWASIIHSPINGGFSSGNNLGIKSVNAEMYLLLNSDTFVRSGAIGALARELKNNNRLGVIGPRLEYDDGIAQTSCFRNRTPFNEILRSAATGPITKLANSIGVREVTLPVSDDSFEPDWLSFACVMIRKEVFETTGYLDDGYFMYLEDNDFCRRVKKMGWCIQYEPLARVVHLNKGASSLGVKRQPHYYYMSRSRYLRKFYGRLGLLTANILWSIGRLISLSRENLGNKKPHLPEKSWRDIWIGFLKYGIKSFG